MTANTDNFKGFDALTTDLPLFGRSLFQAAAETAKENIKGVPKETLDELYSQYMGAISEGPSGVDLDEIDRSAPTGPELFDRPDKNPRVHDYLEKLSNPPNFISMLVKSAKNAPANDIVLISSLLLLKVIAGAKIEEDTIIERNPQTDYKTLCAAMDDWIFTVHTLSSMIQYMPIGQKLTQFQGSRVKRSLKGVKARLEPFKELEAAVLDEHDAHHKAKSAAMAARDIHGKLTSSSWLNDENGQPLSVDPTALFTKWIRTHRATPKNGS